MSGSQEKQRPKETDTPQSSANFGRITVDCEKLLQLQAVHPRNPASKPKLFQPLKSKNIQRVQQEKKVEV
jgi:NADPH-dependent ferric siderophore reductase